jgi:tetratricopeptide (TPR) repeat protein
MPPPDPFSAYLQLAEEVYSRALKPAALREPLTALPPIDRGLLDRLAVRSEEVALAQPRLAWAICLVAEKACRDQDADLFTRSLAAWYLARAANRWAQPKLVERAVNRARKGFAALGEKGWLAACDWQANELAWTRPDFKRSERELQSALSVLTDEGFTEFAPLCRLALSYSQILLRKFPEAEANIALCEGAFAADPLNLARCWRNRSQSLRQQNKLSEARSWALRAEAQFTQCNSALDLAIVWNVLGWIDFYGTTDIEKPLYWLGKAQGWFSAAEMSLWVAYIDMLTGLVHMVSGSLKNAQKHYLRAEGALKKHSAVLTAADNELALGNLNLMLGQPFVAIKNLSKAQALYLSVGDPLSEAVAKMVTAESYTQLGRFQEAIVMHEQAIDQLRPLKNFLRLGSSEKALALTWQAIGNPAKALEHLSKAEDYLRVTSQHDSTVAILLLKADLAVGIGKPDLALEALQTALTLSQKNTLRVQTALANCALGDLLTGTGEPDQAESHLQRALRDFEKMGFAAEACGCRIRLGNLHRQRGNRQDAMAAYQRALSLSAGAYPEQDWRAQAGLAELEKPEEALPLYRKAVQTLNRVRANFWQPDLAGSYARSPRPMFVRAVSLAMEMAAPEEAMYFIESDKATSLERQLMLSRLEYQNKEEGELTELKSEINWLEGQIRALSTSSRTFQMDPRVAELRQQLGVKKLRCAAVMARSERRQATAGMSGSDFSTAALRHLLDDRLGRNWAALEYYLLEKEIAAVYLTHAGIQGFTIPLNQRLLKALDVCDACHQQPVLPSPADLKILGNTLVPASIRQSLTPQTTLLIVPHASLHGLPWSALGEPSLVNDCVPVVVPSLKSLGALLARRREKPAQPVERGLFVGIGSFAGCYPDLASVEMEGRAVFAIAGSSLQLAPQDVPDLAALRSLLHPGNHEEPFAWFHQATHFFTDMTTGRLSGIALGKEDIWIDQLRELAPLPQTVIFSGCNSIHGKRFAGDEQISLINACLAAGADRVIGSTWPVPDRAAVDLVSRYYECFTAGNSPALSLCLAQRAEIKHGGSLDAWAGFSCLGLP